MSNPTTPFGWQMPENTDLVTDLPADFEVFGQAVATDLQYLLGGTTGQVLSKGSATDLDFDWVAATAGDIEGVTAGTGISGGGTSGTVTVTNSMATAIDAKGDLIVGTGADAFSRLAVGATNGHVLTVDSAEATGLKYAAVAGGGMTLLSTTSLSGATTTISSISQDYLQLYMVITGVTNATASGQFILEPNDDDNYQSSIINSGTTWNVINGGSLAIFLSNTVDTVTRTSTENVFTVTINNYTSSLLKTFSTEFGYSGAPGRCFGGATGYSRLPSAVTSLVFRNNGGDLSTGTVLLYGVK
jgi:hypothetical protein